MVFGSFRAFATSPELSDARSRVRGAMTLRAGGLMNLRYTAHRRLSLRSRGAVMFSAVLLLAASVMVAAQAPQEATPQRLFESGKTRRRLTRSSRSRTCRTISAT